MKIEALERTWEVKPITWGQRRKLYAEHAQIYVPSLFNNNGEVGELRIDWEKYYFVIEVVIGVAFDDPKKTLNELTDPEIDSLAQIILKRYLKQGKKENGGSD